MSWLVLSLIVMQLLDIPWLKPSGRCVFPMRSVPGYPLTRCSLSVLPGKDSCGAAKLESKTDESSDIPILEDTSSSPNDCPQLCWLVATDIENIERCGRSDMCFCLCVCVRVCVCAKNHESFVSFVLAEIWEKWRTFSVISGRLCLYHWRIKVGPAVKLHFTIIVSSCFLPSVSSCFHPSVSFSFNPSM